MSDVPIGHAALHVEVCLDVALPGLFLVDLFLPDPGCRIDPYRFLGLCWAFETVKGAVERKNATAGAGTETNAELFQCGMDSERGRSRIPGAPGGVRDGPGYHSLLN